MTRDEVLKGLREARSDSQLPHGYGGILDAAIALLQSASDAEIEAALDVITEAAEMAEATLKNPTVRWDSGLGGACDKGYWERRAAGMRLGLRALDALAREPASMAVSEMQSDRIAALEAQVTHLKCVVAIPHPAEGRVGELEARIVELEGILASVDKETGAI